MGKGRKKKIILITIVVILVLGTFGFINAAKSPKQEGMFFRTVDIVKESIESHVQTTGEVLSIEKREIIPNVTEKVLNVAVEEGQKVTTGQVLMELDDAEVAYELKQAEIKLEMEKDALQDLKMGDKLEEEINKSNAQIRYNEAKRDYDQIKELYEQGAVSLNEFNKAKRELDEANNGLILAEKSADDLSDVSRQEKQIELSKLSLEKLREDQLNYKIVSPIDGTVVKINSKEGSVVSTSEPALVIMNMDQLEIKGNISEYEVDKVQLGDPVTITGDAIEGKEYQGKVKYIAPTAVSVEAGQGKETVVEIKVGVEDPDTKLKPGFSSTIDILAEVKEDVLVIPYEAIFTRKDGQKIIFSVQDGKAKAHDIETGIESDLVVEVIGDDIKENDKIILNPTENIKDGDPVNTDVVMGK